MIQSTPVANDMARGSIRGVDISTVGFPYTGGAYAGVRAGDYKYWAGLMVAMW